MYIGMSNDFYRPTKIASCAPGFIPTRSLSLALDDGNGLGPVNA